MILNKFLDLQNDDNTIYPHIKFIKYFSPTGVSKSLIRPPTIPLYVSCWL